MGAILGTAGHIDHGKTSLIRALTTIDCDRLQEEKKRGITIDLGFAWLDLPNGDRLGIIDVPGHERFVRTMVAGACGIDCVLLVIAADEGIMPQTKEHLEICQILGVRQGIVAITKIDLVEADWLAMVVEECKATLATTFLEHAPIFPVSAKTHAGIDALKAELIERAQTLRTKSTSSLFRLPIDRVFTLHGHGTVVTGTVLSGQIAVGDPLVVYPQGTPTKARSLERHETAVESLDAGNRCAINLQGLETSDISRGDTIAKPQTLLPSRRWFVELRALASAKNPLKQRTTVRFHHGTKECGAKLVFRDRNQLDPGDSAFAEVVFDQDMCALFGDKAVLRASSPLQTIAGASVLCPIPPLWPKKKDRPANLHQDWLALQDMRENAPADFIVQLLTLLGLPGATWQQLMIATALPSSVLTKTLKHLQEEQRIVCWDAGEKEYERAWIERQQFSALLSACLDKASAIHKKFPLRPSFAKEELNDTWSQGLPKKLIQKTIDRACSSKKLVQEGDGLRLASHSVRLATQTATLRDALLAAYAKTPLSPPNYKDVLETLHIQEKEAAPILNLLLSQGELIKIKEGLFYTKSAHTTIMQHIDTWFASHETLDINDLKGLLSISRKYLIALLEYMDNTHKTVRVGTVRKLRAPTRPRTAAHASSNEHS